MARKTPPTPLIDRVISQHAATAQDELVRRLRMNRAFQDQLDNYSNEEFLVFLRRKVDELRSEELRYRRYNRQDADRAMYERWVLESAIRRLDNWPERVES